MANRIDAAIQDMESLMGTPVSDRARSHSASEQLLSRDHAVLLLHDCGSQAI
jgi:hypothetical protein